MLRRLKKLIYFVVLIGFIAFIGGLLLVFYYYLKVPDPSLIAIRRINESTKIYYNDGETLLYDVHAEEKRTVISWDEIPVSVRNATLAAEDTDFYNHQGIDFSGIVRALLRDVSSLSASQGGSTITQQLVKLTIVGQDKTISRKIKEAILAIKIEKKYSKDQIFWMYLNQIPYGSNAYGIEAASQTYFNKKAKDLNLKEATILASLPKGPSYYSPFGSRAEELMARSEHILKRMLELGMITQEQYDAANKETPVFVRRREKFEAAHFVMEVKEYLINKYGEDLVRNGGLKVVTTLDKEKQKLAEELVTKYGDINEKKYKADNAALISIDPKTGYVLAMVGSRDYWNIERKGNYNVAINTIRQPGSSFKPFAYATAIAEGFTDNTILFDLKTEFNPSCNPDASQNYGSGACYHPRNYLGTFSGPVTMRQALARSLNIPSVKILYLAGIDSTVETARRMGITSLDGDNYYGLSLVLGGAGVSLLDMTSAYGVFANDGIRNPYTYIVKITNGDGAVLEEFTKKDERVLPQQVARMISDILSDNSARAAVFGVNNSLILPGRPVAAKTGTTQNNRDGWVIGYTPSLVTGIWTGNTDDSPMTAAGAGLSAAGPMWNEFMRTTLASQPVDYFIKPLPMNSNKNVLNGSFIDDNGEIHSILYYVRAQDPNGAQPLNPYDDPQYANWEYSVRSWVGQIRQTPAPTPFEQPQDTTSPLPSF